jgi:hypothetical protein
VTEKKTWQVTAEVLFPNEFPIEVVEGAPRPAEVLEPKSRIPAQQRELDGFTVFIRPGDPQRVPGAEGDIRVAVASLTARMESEAQTPTAAAEAAMPLLDRILESLSFQMQCALQIDALGVVDMTGEPAVGDMRALARWSGFPRPTFQLTAVPTESLVSRRVPDLTIDLDPTDEKANRALDWYLKALTARFEADHFIFLWIATDILAGDSDLKVREPFRGRCGHVIAQCPECEISTEKPVQGPSVKRFLTEGFGMDTDVAARIWEARQMLHGRHEFDSKVMQQLSELSQHLRAVVVAALKPRLGIPDDEPPFVATTGPSILPIAGLEGERPITQDDLTPLDKRERHI